MGWGEGAISEREPQEEALKHGTAVSPHNLTSKT